MPPRNDTPPSRSGRRPISRFRRRQNQNELILPLPPSDLSVVPQGHVPPPRYAHCSTTKPQKLKIEMCRNIVQGIECPFGNSCSYAHRPSELQVLYLKDRAEAGEIDNETFRNKPCFDHVATGACPFGDRCTSIHDPGIESKIGAWLPRISRLNEVATDLHVDWKSFYNFSTIQHSSPLGKETPEAFRSVEAFGRILRNDDEATLSLPSSRRPGAMIHLHRLEIALNMYISAESSSNTRRKIKYIPSHFVFGRLCMIAQVKAFRVMSGAVMEIPLEHCIAGDPSTVVVHELIFGPNLKNDELPPSLWFNLPPEAIVESSFDAELKYNRERVRDKDTNTARSRLQHQQPPPLRKQTSGRIQFDLMYEKGLLLHHTYSIPAFVLYYPDDEELYNLIITSIRLDIDILHDSMATPHRIHSTSVADANEELSSPLLHYRRLTLANKFDGLKSYFLHFSNWPKSKDWVEEPGSSTPVPDARRKYLISINYPHSIINSNMNCRLWYSFVDTLSKSNESLLSSSSSSSSSLSSELHDHSSRMAQLILPPFAKSDHDGKRLHVFSELSSAAVSTSTDGHGHLPRNLRNLPLLPITIDDHNDEKAVERHMLGLHLDDWQLIQTYYKNK